MPTPKIADYMQDKIKVRKRIAKKEFSYEDLINAKRNDPWKPVAKIVKDLGLDVSVGMAQRIIRDAKNKKLL